MKIHKLLSVLFLLFFLGCSSPKSVLDGESKGNNQIPAEFDPRQGTLLIDFGPKSEVIGVNNYSKMRGFTAKMYPGSYEYATYEEILDNKKYPDLENYHYALVCAIVESPVVITKSSPTIYRFYIYDRVSGKTYSSLGMGSSVKTLAYKWAMQALEDKEKK